MESPQHFLGGFDTMILGFLEDGNAAEVGVGKQDSAIPAPQAATFFGENRSDRGADHGVTHAQDVDPRDALANVGVYALEVVENGFFPVGPILF
ncbi:MAG: hypothetical protein DMG51_11260 [Acidobacteria bacterium]|nr:MAG: hypothetical protein DMG51_11260 [Acidobacteriota bacterium]